MLERLQVRNFKSLRDLEVEFGRLTVLVGPNGCGKSSVLQAIDVVRGLALIEPTQKIGPPFSAEAISRPSDSADAPELAELRLVCANQGSRAKLEAKLTALADFPALLDVERSSLICETEAEEPFEKDWSKRGVPAWVDAAFGNIELYQLDTRIMERPAYSDEAHPVLGAHGENLAVVLDALQGSRREHFDAIEADLCKFITGLRRVRLRRVTVPTVRTVIVDQRFQRVEDTVAAHQVVLDFEFARSVAADQASEGTLLLLGLLTVIGAEPERPMTVMLDDLDRALHPKAQRELVGYLHQLLDSRPNLQIIATSHSPYLVEHLAYEEVLAMTQSPVDGRSLIAPLDQHPDAARWRDEMSAGEFWSSVGEDWILPGQST